MHKHHLSDKTLTPDQLRDLMAQAETNGRPVMAYRVVGSRVELHQLGGAIANINIETEDTVVQSLSKMKKDQLLALADKMSINGRSSMTKAELIEAITQAQEE